MKKKNLFTSLTFILIIILLTTMIVIRENNMLYSYQVDVLQVASVIPTSTKKQTISCLILE